MGKSQVRVLASQFEQTNHQFERASLTRQVWKSMFQQANQKFEGQVRSREFEKTNLNEQVRTDKFDHARLKKKF